MGGQALKIAKTRRYESQEYKYIIDDIFSIIGNEIKVYIAPSYKNKESHGDLDVLIHSGVLNEKNINLRKYIEEKFKPTEIVKNTSVYSFDYKELQIDFIVLKTSDWETSKIYYSYNDLGNLMGRIAYNMGLRYGHFGLGYKHLYKGRTTGTINISRDPEKIFKFLGFDWERYLEGFRDLEDIFEYVINSKYFNPRVFDYEKLNHQNRTRNKKRKTYQKFLEYLENKNFNTFFIFGRDKTKFIRCADDYFKTDIEGQIEIFNKKIELREKASEIFNGNIIMEHFPNLKGKQLGNTISKFKNTINGDYHEYLLSKSTEELLKEFKEIVYE